MVKQKKKRNKVYHGADASVDRPTITRLKAANRNIVSQWWFEKKIILKPVLIISGVIVVLIVLIAQIVRLVNGG